MACEKRPTLSANRILRNFSIIKAKQGITLYFASYQLLTSNSLHVGR